MSLLVATWISTAATFGLLVGAGLTVYFAARAFGAQSRQLKDQQSVSQRQTVVLELQAKELRASLTARNEATSLLLREHASAIAAWLDEPQAAGLGWHVTGHILNTGERPVREVSACWYVSNSPILEPVQLASCLLGHAQENFDCRVGEDEIRGGNLRAIIQFRTIADDWWSVGTDGQLSKMSRPFNDATGQQ
jgi:hypothetical protein